MQTSKQTGREEWGGGLTCWNSQSKEAGGLELEASILGSKSRALCPSMPLLPRNWAPLALVPGPPSQRVWSHLKPRHGFNRGMRPRRMPSPGYREGEDPNYPLSPGISLASPVSRSWQGWFGHLRSGSGQVSSEKGWCGARSQASYLNKGTCQPRPCPLVTWA